ncbi:MAG: Trk system potassium transporter TrkA [Acetatifactor sp.]|nr:Trk system potassium transporter TrkA [Acetatifactor sp.]
MKIIIAGEGKMGAALTRHLSLDGDDLTLIDSNPKVLEASEERYDIMIVQGNCASMDILLQAGVKEADLLIAVTGADEINLLCCMTAHNLNPNIHTIARVRNPEYFNQIYKMRNMFALSMMVNPENQAAVEIARLLRYPGFLKRDTFAKGRVEIVELRIDENSKLCNVPLMDMAGIVKCKTLVCAVLRNGAAVAPDGKFVLKAGDRIFVTAAANELTTLLKNLGIITHKVKSVMICGGGGISYYLAKHLESSGVNVQIIDNDRERCDHLAEVLPNACIIHGDATDRHLLEDEGIYDCDALVTMTGLDELNMVVSLYANSCGVPQVITKLGHMDNAGILGDLTLGSVISPKELTSNTIARYVRAMKNHEGAALTVHSIADGQAEAVEFVADETTKHCGEPLKTLKLKKGVLLVCITKGGKTEIPNGDSFFEPGNTVIIVTDHDKRIYQLNEIFE